MRIVLEGVYYGRNHYTDYPCTILRISESTDQPGRDPISAKGGVQHPDRKAYSLRCMQVLNSLEQPIPSAAAISEQLASQSADELEYTARLALAITKSLLEHIGASPKRIEISSTPLPAWPSGLPIAFSYDDSLIAEQSARMIRDLLRFIIDGEKLDAEDGKEPDFAAEVSRLKQLREERSVSFSSAALAAEAAARRIPRISFGLWPFKIPEGTPVKSALSFYQLGQGKYHQGFRNALPLPLSAATEKLLRNRVALNRHLYQAGIPVPRVESEFTNINSARRAVRAADRVGYPVVLKTSSEIDGSRVLPGLNDAAAVTFAFEQLRGTGRRVVVENHVSGDVFRCLVAGGEVLAACRRRPLDIVGDGDRTISQLLWAEPGGAQFPILGSAHLRDVRSRLKQALEMQALNFDSVLPRGAVVRLQEGAEPLTSEPVADVLEELRSLPSVLDLARDAVACLGLRASAVEIAVQYSDGVPMPESATVVALDPDPDLAFHRRQREFLPMHAAALYLDALLPPASDLRVQIAAVTGTNGKTTTCFMLDFILKQAGRTTGLACSDGFYIQGERQEKAIMSGIRGALRVFSNDTVDTAILETSRGTLLEKGLAFDNCDVAACLNITADHLGEDGVGTLEQLAVVKRTVVSSARRAAVLNGEDQHCLAMLEHCNAERIYLIYSSIPPAEITSWLGPGRYAIFVRGEGPKCTIMVSGADGDMPIIDVQKIPATWNGTAIHNVQNAMFAIGMALGLSIEPEIIRNALARFSSSIDVMPGRLNLFDALPFKVLIDYAHNAHGYQALCRCVQNLAVSGKRTLIVFSPGRQSDAERKAIAETVVGEFDAFICRGRHRSKNDTEPDTSPQALRSALLAAGANENAVELVPDIGKAVELALMGAGKGDLVVVSATGRYRQVWDQLSAFREGKLLSDSESASRDAVG